MKKTDFKNITYKICMRNKKLKPFCDIKKPKFLGLDLNSAL